MNRKWENKGDGSREELLYEVKEWAARAADSYEELAKLFSGYVVKKDAWNGQDKKRIFERVSEQVCKSCLKYRYCWDRYEEASCQAFGAALHTMEGSGCLAFTELPQFFQMNCICPQELTEELNLGVSMERMRLAAFNQMMEGKDALVRQLTETARTIESIPKQLLKETEVSDGMKSALRKSLRRIHVHLLELHLLERFGTGRQLKLRVRCDAGRSVSLRLLERLVSEACGVTMKETSQWGRLIAEQERSLLFQEEPAYFTMTGVARLAKQEADVSGDSFSFLSQEDGELAMILSDGMGSGEDAAKESEAVLTMLERLLEAGFEEETSIRLLNSVLALRAEQKSFATLDMSILNLYTGVCEFVKIGGAATFVKRKEWLECVEAETLPIGMVQNVDYDSLTKKLYDGDYVIMMSDGVMDAIAKEKQTQFLKTVIGEDTEQNPQVMAGRILNGALSCQNFEPRDDMTVLVCGLFKRGR